VHDKTVASKLAPKYDVTVEALRGCINRGLVRHHPKAIEQRKPAYTLTREGALVVELLISAGLIEQIKEKAA
jgi:hypothetical protein